jgi:hypothetical protein
MQPNTDATDLQSELGITDPEKEYDLKSRVGQLKRLLSNIRRRVRDENDIVMAYSGAEGSGKSTLAIKHGFDLDDHFTVDANIMVNPDVEQLQNKILHELPPHSCIVVDEAIRVLYKRDFSTTQNKFLVKLFAVSRKCKKIVSLCIPDFNDLDPYYRKHRVKLWWYVPARGRAILFAPSPSPFSKEPWHLDQNEKRMIDAMGNKSFSDFGVDEMLTHIRNPKVCPNYVMDFEFGKMPAKVEERYLENVAQLRKEMDYKKEQEKDEKEKKNRYRDFYYNMRGDFATLVRYLSQQKAFSYTDTAMVLGKDKKQVQKIMESDMQYRLKQQRRAKEAGIAKG